MFYMQILNNATNTVIPYKEITFIYTVYIVSIADDYGITIGTMFVFDSINFVQIKKNTTQQKLQ